jgi:hypothetical protein
MKGLSPWALSAMAQLKTATQLHQAIIGQLNFQVLQTRDSVWISVIRESGNPIYFCTCTLETGGMLGIKTRVGTNSIRINMETLIGDISTEISVGADAHTFLTYKTTLTPKTDLFLPFCPRDILLAGSASDTAASWGELHLSQIGTRSGLAYFSREKSKLRVLYLQNLTSLSAYAQQTGNTLGGAVSGDVPEIGLSLPPATEKPLKKGAKIVISDAIICMKALESTGSDISLDYLDLLASAYLLMPRPETHYLQWPEILEKGLKDLIENPGCWSMVAGKSYLNAYVSDYDTPPEIMVQLAVLLPLIDYSEWSGKDLEIIKRIKDGLPAF